MEIDHQDIARFAQSLRGKGKLNATIESYCRDAQRFLNFLTQMKLAPTKVERDTLLKYQIHLQETLGEKENSVRRTIIGVRQFYRFLAESRKILDTPFDTVPIPERQDLVPSVLKLADIDRVIAVAEKETSSLVAARNAAIIALLAFEGIKATELIDLRWSDFLSSDDSASLHIKGTRVRTINLLPKTQQLLLNYQDYFRKFQDHPALARVTARDRRVFLSFKGRDASLPIPHMTRHGLKFIVYELGDQVGIKRLNTELLRHFAVNHLMESGKSPEEVMQHLGLRRLGNIARHSRTQGRPLSPRAKSPELR